jgi:L-ascorbate metabolism protein UlaG (beta-lactamase superfamily)
MQRRTVLGGAGLAGLTGVAGLGAWAYRAAPHFWKQYSKDLKRDVLPAPFRPDPKAWPDRGLYAAWLGHTTVLLKIDGTTVLTDPVFSMRVGIDLGLATLGPKRLVAPALDVGDLPKIDLLLLSHAHMDHFDLPSLRSLESRATRVVTAAKTGDLLSAGRYAGVTELGWGQRVGVGPLEIRAFQVNHWGARMNSDTYRGYNGYTIEAGRYRVLFGGDTALTAVFCGLKALRPFDLAIMPVGAYNPWIHYHCTPEQSWRMADDAGAEFVLPVHHQTFPLSREPFLEPIERVLAAAGNHPDRVAVRRIGQEFRLNLS